jgi:hypothetical protein
MGIYSSSNDNNIEKSRIRIPKVKLELMIRYELVPMGNYSKVLVKSNPTVQYEM